MCPPSKCTLKELGHNVVVFGLRPRREALQVLREKCTFLLAVWSRNWARVQINIIIVCRGDKIRPPPRLLAKQRWKMPGVFYQSGDSDDWFIAPALLALFVMMFALLHSSQAIKMCFPLESPHWFAESALHSATHNANNVTLRDLPMNEILWANCCWDEKGHSEKSFCETWSFCLSLGLGNLVSFFMF